MLEWGDKRTGKIPKDGVAGKKLGRGLELPSMQFGFDRSKLLLTFLATVLIFIKVMTIKIKHTCCKEREREGAHD